MNYTQTIDIRGRLGAVALESGLVPTVNPGHILLSDGRKTNIFVPVDAYMNEPTVMASIGYIARHAGLNPSTYTLDNPSDYTYENVVAMIDKLEKDVVELNPGFLTPDDLDRSGSYVVEMAEDYENDDMKEVAEVIDQRLQQNLDRFESLDDEEEGQRAINHD